MAYTAGDSILDDEYNNFVGKATSPFGINHTGGTGSAQYGLGESAVSTVSANNLINASEWNALFAAMDVVAGHFSRITGSGFIFNLEHIIHHRDDNNIRKCECNETLLQRWRQSPGHWGSDG